MLLANNTLAESCKTMIAQALMQAKRAAHRPSADSVTLHGHGNCVHASLALALVPWGRITQIHHSDTDSCRLLQQWPSAMGVLIKKCSHQPGCFVSEPDLAQVA